MKIEHSLQPLQHCVIFPKIAASLGGAEYVRFSPRLAIIKMPGRAKEVKIPRSQVPNDFTSFSLADLVHAYLAKG